jgi:hypothetical protein
MSLDSGRDHWKEVFERLTAIETDSRISREHTHDVLCEIKEKLDSIIDVKEPSSVVSRLKSLEDRKMYERGAIAVITVLWVELRGWAKTHLGV